MNMCQYREEFNGHSMINLNEIKMIIWDLDNTLWHGTLGEKDIDFTDSMMNLIIRLSKRGIVNSICSKNDYLDAMEVLKEKRIDYYFVFISINYEPKGQRIVDIIQKSKLGAKNVLFIDDNAFNLEEVKFYNPGICVAPPSIILDLEANLENIGKDDSSLSRLKQYRLLEKKEDDLKIFNSNEEFLYQSNIRVEIFQNVMDEFDRLFELMERTNHLNYTKVRQTKEEFKCCLMNKNVQKGYIKVTDKYGDYGIVGFWVIADNRAKHYVFSCRVLGMGIEQYVYSYLDFPTIPINGEVSVQLVKNKYVPWIKLNYLQDTSSVKVKPQVNSLKKILVKGRCDLNNIIQYLRPVELINENNFINPFGYDTSLSTCTTNIVLAHRFSQREQMEIASIVPMFDCALNKTNIFTSDFSVAIISLASEYSFGVYRVKNNYEKKVSVGDYFFDMTDKKIWDKYINKEIYTLGYSLSKKVMKPFAKRFEKVELCPNDVIDNVKYIRNNMPTKSKLVLILGNDKYKSQIATSYEEERLQRYKALNIRVLTCFGNCQDIIIIDANEFLRGPCDVTDTIMHYERRVYYNIAQKINYIIGL